MQLVWDDKQVQIITVAIFLIIFGAHKNILFIIAKRFLCLLSVIYGPPLQLCWLLGLEWSNLF